MSEKRSEIRLEPIQRREIADPYRSAIQERAIFLVQNNAAELFDAYERDERSFGGRYVCADLFKEVFPDFSRSKESRNYANTAVHNAAAVLASEQLRHVLTLPITGDRDKVIFLTGVPGAGKTSTVAQAGKMAEGVFAVYEGQLANPATGIRKIQDSIESGFKPVIFVVHTLSETALQNTCQRFSEYGRGASVEVMATIQGKLPDGLAAIYDRFKDEVELQIFDRRNKLETVLYDGWEHLDILRSEGQYEHIKQKLTQSVERYYEQGLITEECFRQAKGMAPLIGREAGYSSAGRGDGSDGDGQRISQTSSSENFLTGYRIELPKCGATYTGKILALNSDFAYQDVGKNIVIKHSLENRPELIAQISAQGSHRIRYSSDMNMSVDSGRVKSSVKINSR